MRHFWFIVLLLISSVSLQAEPFINTSDIYLKANISLLANRGYITSPITTYPLMWNNIADDLARISITQLSADEQQAYFYVKYQLDLAKRNLTTLSADVATHNKRFTSFGEAFRERNNLSLNSTWMNNNFAVNISSHYSKTAVDHGKTRIDGSYLAGFWGNWVISVGEQDRWFGPTWDSSISLTNNAHPMPAIAISRKSAIPFTLPFTSYQIPWTVTSFMARMNDTRVIRNALLWGFRLNFKPTPALEIGISRLAQWGGDNRPKDFKTFWEVLIGKDNCGASGRSGLDCTNGNPQPGNQQAGYDARLNLNSFHIPLVIYGQYFAEDGNSRSWSFITQPRYQGGIESQFSALGLSNTVYIEYTNTYLDCTADNNSPVGDCFYEHSLFATGMRYEQRTLGNLYDNDAKTVVLGLISDIDNNSHFTIKYRWLKLNVDNHDKAPNSLIIGNPLTKIAENMQMLSGSYRHSYKNWRLTVGSDISRSSFVNNINSKNQINVFAKIEYNL